MRHCPLGPTIALATLLALGATSGARADPGAYGHPVYAAPAYGYAGNLVDGTYVGAPFTRVPSPSRIVPPAWGYGTYGVPTVAGMRDAPVARPALYVVERQGPAVNRLAPRRSARVVSRSGQGLWTDVPSTGSVERSGAQVVSVRVPAR